MSDERIYNVTAGGTTDAVTGRANAVTMAKTMSQENQQRVTVEREDGMETMQFSNGSLDTFVCETRARKPRAKENKENKESAPRGDS